MESGCQCSVRHDPATSEGSSPVVEQFWCVDSRGTRIAKNSFVIRARSAMQSKAIDGAMRAASVLGAACLLMTLTGCAADGASQAQGEGRPDLVPSPARDLVRPGHAELVLTNDRWPTFEEARANPSTSVTGDSPLYAHIRTARSLGELALPADPRGRYSFSAYPHLYLQVGDTESLRNASTCYVTLSPGQLGSRELVVQLAHPRRSPMAPWRIAGLPRRLRRGLAPRCMRSGWRVRRAI